MTDLEFVHEDIPSSQELAVLLHETSTPIDGLLALYEHLAIFEKKHAMRSSDFINRYAQGEFDDAAEWLQWVGLYHITEVLRLRIQGALFYKE